MFIRTGTLELLNTRTQHWTGFGTYKALEEQYKMHLKAKDGINKFFGLTAENNYRLYLEMPQDVSIEDTAIVKKIKNVVIKLSPKKIDSIAYATNTVIFKNDKNVYKLSKIINQLLKDNIKAFKPIISYFNSYGLYPFQVTVGNINTCICDLKGNPSRKVLITTNFEDFILSSNQTSWGNCTRLGGSYEGAPRALALDSCTFIAGLVNKPKFENKFCNRWISRRWGYRFHKDIFGLNRVFGSSVAASVNPILEFISKKLGGAISKKVTGIYQYDILSSNGVNYMDSELSLYDFNNKGVGGAVIAEDTKKRIKKIYVGCSEIACPVCNRPSNRLCNSCYNSIREDYKNKTNFDTFDNVTKSGTFKHLFNSQFNAKLY